MRSNARNSGVKSMCSSVPAGSSGSATAILIGPSIIIRYPELGRRWRDKTDLCIDFCRLAHSTGDLTGRRARPARRDIHDCAGIGQSICARSKSISEADSALLPAGRWWQKEALSNLPLILCLKQNDDHNLW